MILICEEKDIKPESRNKEFGSLRQRDLSGDAHHASAWAETVYVMRNDVAQLIKARNDPFTPEIPMSVLITEALERIAM